MRYLPFTLIIFLFACSSKRSIINKYLNGDNLTAQQLTININADTSLLLQNGTKLIIPAGSLKTKDGKPAKLIAKEAVTIQQITLAGLSTMSNGKPLRSGGMLFLDGAPGEDVKIVKPITAEIPTASADTAMQLYKGEVKDDGSINWTDPTTIKVKEDPSLVAGHQLFMQNCASCHHPVKDGQAPGLFGAEERIGNMDVYYQFVNNPNAMMACNPYFQDQNNKFGGVMMQSFPNLTHRDIDAIIYYVNKEGGGQKGTYISKDDFSYDSCQYYKELYHILTYSRDSLNRVRERENFANVNSEASTDTTPITFTEPVIPIRESATVRPQSYQADYYQFNINTFGWNNVDVLEGNDVKDCELTVNLAGNHSAKNEVFLVIPAFKIFMRGGLMDDSVNYAFKYADGKIPLKENLDAYVFVIGESSDTAQLFFGATRFTTALKANLDIKMESVTQEQLTKNMKSFNFTDINFSVNRTYTKETIKTVEDRLLMLKYKVDRCNCNGTYPGEAMVAYSVDSANGDYQLAIPSK
jgi:mono/diheme cytochrome c family protein